MTCSVCGASNTWYPIPTTDLIRCPNCFNTLPAPKTDAKQDKAKSPKTK